VSLSCSAWQPAMKPSASASKAMRSSTICVRLSTSCGGGRREAEGHAKGRRGQLVRRNGGGSCWGAALRVLVKGGAKALGAWARLSVPRWGSHPTAPTAPPLKKDPGPTMSVLTCTDMPKRSSSCGRSSPSCGVGRERQWQRRALAHSFPGAARDPGLPGATRANHTPQYTQRQEHTHTAKTRTRAKQARAPGGCRCRS
jgi:hypothetical protein